MVLVLAVLACMTVARLVVSCRPYLPRRLPVVQRRLPVDSLAAIRQSVRPTKSPLRPRVNLPAWRLRRSRHVARQLRPSVLTVRADAASVPMLAPRPAESPQAPRHQAPLVAQDQCQVDSLAATQQPISHARARLSARRHSLRLCPCRSLLEPLLPPVQRVNWRAWLLCRWPHAVHCQRADPAKVRPRAASVLVARSRRPARRQAAPLAGLSVTLVLRPAGSQRATRPQGRH